MLKQFYKKGVVEAGLDEVGRGCLAGPVVAAAVVLPQDFFSEVLNDSKKLNAKTRISLEEEIKEHAISYAVAEVSHTEIDEINILNASFLAMHRALDQLSVCPELLLVDGNRFVKYEEIEHVCVIKGDGKYLSIAAASVLAKNYRDRLMSTLGKEYPEYGWDTNVGYPTKKHRKAIAEFGPTPHHRMSFTLLPKQLKIFEDGGE